MSAHKNTEHIFSWNEVSLKKKVSIYDGFFLQKILEIREKNRLHTFLLCLCASVAMQYAITSRGSIILMRENDQ